MVHTCDRNGRGLGRGFCPRRVLARGGIIVSPAYTYKECVKYWCSMRINTDLNTSVPNSRFEESIKYLTIIPRARMGSESKISVKIHPSAQTVHPSGKSILSHISGR